MITKATMLCINFLSIHADYTLIMHESTGVDVSMAAHSRFNLQLRLKREEQERLLAEAEESAAVRDLIKSCDLQRGVAANTTRRSTS